MTPRAAVDLVVRQARLLDREGLWDIGVHAGVITGVTEHGAGRAFPVTVAEVDAGGRLVVPALVEPHIHLDKAFLAETDGGGPAESLAEAVRRVREAKRGYTVAGVRDRAMRALELYAALGTSHLRTHVDVDPGVGLVALEGVLEAREAFRDTLTVQVVAFPHAGLTAEPAAYDFLVAALDRGADVVGGMPEREPDVDAGRRHLELVTGLAQARGLPVDVHIDEADDGSSRFLQHLAVLTVERSLQGRVTASHACALAAYAPAERARVIDLLKRAGIGVVVCPQTNLFLGGRGDPAAPRRGLAPARELLAAGIPVACGQDNLRDMFCPYGSGDPLQNAHIAALACHLSPREAVELVTGGAAAVLGLTEYGVQADAAANLIITEAVDAAELLAGRPRRLLQLRHGRPLSAA